jgi:hypothetical protein
VVWRVVFFDDISVVLESWNSLVKPGIQNLGLVQYDPVTFHSTVLRFALRPTLVKE